MCGTYAQPAWGDVVKGVQGTDERRAQLEAWMDDRRNDRRLRWAEVARRAGMTVENLLRIRKGRISISWEAASGIEDALQWEQGSVEAAVTEGRAPTPKAASGPQPPPSLWTAEMETKFRLLKDILKSQGLEMTEQNFLTMLDQGRIELRTRQNPDPVSADDRG